MNQTINVQSQQVCDQGGKSVYRVGDMVITVESMYQGQKNIKDLLMEYLQGKVTGNKVF